MKPELSTEQKDKFIEDFIKIIQKSSENIQKDFQNNSNIYFDIANNPIIESQVQFRFSPRLKDEYTILTNRLKNRTI